MHERLSVLIKATGTIIFCTSTLMLALANTPHISAQNIEHSSGEAPANFIAQPINEKNKSQPGTNAWIQNLPVSWHSHLTPVLQTLLTSIHTKRRPP